MNDRNENIKYKKVIFVSEDDTYRSPVAAALLKSKLLRGVPQIESRGLVVLFNEPPNQKGVYLLKEMGIDISKHRSRQIEEKDFKADTLVIMMSERGKKQIYDKFKNALNVYTFREFVGGSGDIEMPYGKDIEEYRENLMQIKSLVSIMADKLTAINNKI